MFECLNVKTLERLNTRTFFKVIMKLVVNGKEIELNEGLTITGLLESLEIDPGRVAVEVNLKIIKRCDFEEQKLNEGDSVEIVNFVGGG